ncbi:MAG: hypothetical protein Q3963_05960 [Coriobacteriaceae bacterium]|nr:hypothetical protein [Coriobacteriaceae bacterium]
MPAMEGATTNPSPTPSTPAANTRKTGARNAVATRFWGRTAGLGKAVRIAALGFVIASIISISFTQLGFWSVGNIEGMSVYVILLLGPLAMGALLFGPRTGTALGLIAGTTVFLHATFFPLDYYEVYFMSPLNSFALMSALGAAGGWQRIGYVAQISCHAADSSTFLSKNRLRGANGRPSGRFAHIKRHTTDPRTLPQPPVRPRVARRQRCGIPRDLPRYDKRVPGRHMYVPNGPADAKRNGPPPK